MLFLHPTTTTLDALPLPGVTTVAVSRKAKSLITDFSDGGPHPAFSDVPQQLTTITITRLVQQPDDALASIALATEADLAFTARRSPDAPHALRCTARIVITAIESAATETKALAQTITALAITDDGAADPLTIEPVSTLTEGAP